jgi:nitroreductase
MRSRAKIVAVFVLIIMTLASFSAYGADISAIQLPNPQREGGKPLMAALNDRMTMRAFSEEKLPMQTLSNLLWAAFGINRPDGRRTAPSARNWQEMDIYVATPEGLFLWDARKNVLDPIVAKDIREMTGRAPFVKEAAVNLVFVADYSRVTGEGGDKDIWVGADAGCIAQNVYLYCASEGLATVVRAGVDREALAKEMKLKPEQKIMFAQSVGYPKK